MMGESASRSLAGQRRSILLIFVLVFCTVLSWNFYQDWSRPQDDRRSSRQKKKRNMSKSALLAELTKLLQHDDEPFRVEKGDKEYSNPDPLFQPFVVERFRLVFFTIPKNGCTMWKYLMRKMSGYTAPLGPRQSIHVPGHSQIRRLGSYSLEQATEFLTSPNWTRAIFLRDPIERWLSAYLEKIVKGKLPVQRCCSKRRNYSNHTSRQECREHMQASPEGGFAVMKDCPNRHWDAQSLRMAPRYWPQINFWGYMERIEGDSEALLRQIGAWDEFGASGWGPNGTQRVFGRQETVGRQHASDAHSKVAKYITPELRAKLVQFYRVDYENPFFNFTTATSR